MTETLRGTDYRALRRLSDVDNATLADVGETCERVSPESLPALLAAGTIEWAVERRTAPTTDVTTPKRPRRPSRGKR